MDAIDRLQGESVELQRDGPPDFGMEDVVDYSQVDYEFNDEDLEKRIRITNGICTKDLISDGIVIDPQIPEAEQFAESAEMGQSTYFRQHAEMLERTSERNKDNRDSEGEDDDDLSEFEQVGRKMKDISPTGYKPGTLMKKELSGGIRTEGCTPDNSTVTLHYSLSLEGQDEPFDSSLLRGRSERYRLDRGQLLPGMEAAVKSMCRREKAQFLIESSLAYGPRGCPPRVPGGVTVLATVELLEVVQEGEAEALLGLDSEERDSKHGYEEIEEAARKEHQNGNYYVARKEWKVSLKHYNRGLRLLQEVTLASEDQEMRQQRLLLKLQLNIAYCALKMQWPKKACLACREALAIDVKHASPEQLTKAIFRFGKAKRMLEDYSAARQLLIKAQERKPDDKDINRELLSLEEQLARDRKNEKELCQGMFRMHARGEEKREREVEEKAELFRDEMEAFRDDDSQEMLLPGTLSSTEIKALRLVADQLSMEVEVLETVKGRKKIRVSKKK